MSTGFPGATSVTRLSVYSGRPAADGLVGGTPHLHLASAEAYVVTGGSGAVHTLDPSGFRVTPLTAGSTVWFTPGTIHRAVNDDGLTIVVIMSNAGLPEAGDAVMTFPPEIVGDPERYHAAAALPSGAPAEQLDEAVRRRRDLAVEGFLALADAVSAGDPRPLSALYDSAVALVRPKVTGWRETWRATVEEQTRHTAAALDGLERGDGSHLRSAALQGSPPSPTAGWGMCGRLNGPHPTM